MYFNLHSFVVFSKKFILSLRIVRNVSISFERMRFLRFLVPYLNVVDVEYIACQEVDCVTYSTLHMFMQIYITCK